MSRPLSGMTGQRPRQLVKGQEKVPGVSVRWTEEHHIAYLRLGGSRWLREQVEKHMGAKRA